jgi:hypothetical protein
MTEPTRDPAKARFFALQLSRLGGLLVIGLGVLLWRTDSIGGAPQPTAGKALLALGLFMALVVPPLLRKRWRSPD